ncbi:MAG TPA: acetyl-CoA carboxylase biotin carboxyl carrier protein subunit, partial [Gemmatimonadales bacterium]|nr:acetyl-CoA carboxylase biotin carboxyl carrier protein subunit [Gemmatimonadales bacterium]
RYHVTLRSRVYIVDVDGGTVTVDGERLEAHAAAIPGTPLIHLLLVRDSWTVAYQQLDGGRWALGAVGERVEVEVQDDRSKQIEALTGRGRHIAVGGVLRASMPGLVVRVEVSEGQTVQVGQALVVVEAMKMENELRATHPGIAERIHVKAGDRVEKGAELVTFKSPSS